MNEDDLSDAVTVKLLQGHCTISNNISVSVGCMHDDDDDDEDDDDGGYVALKQAAVMET